MKIIKASYEIMDTLNAMEILRKIEQCGRVCYKSENRITDESCVKFVRSILNSGHESVIEHFSFSVKFIVDRGVSHEIVRHRIASFSQESTRYCNYSKDGFENECTFIEPFFFEVGSAEYDAWKNACEASEREYMALIKLGRTPQEARSVLPNSLKTELIMTANLREWRHFLKLRTSNASHPQMLEVAVPLLAELKVRVPVIFEGL